MVEAGGGGAGAVVGVIAEVDVRGVVDGVVWDCVAAEVAGAGAVVGDEAGEFVPAAALVAGALGADVGDVGAAWDGVAFAAPVDELESGDEGSADWNGIDVVDTAVPAPSPAAVSSSAPRVVLAPGPAMSPTEAGSTT